MIYHDGFMVTVNSVQKIRRRLKLSGKHDDEISVGFR